MQYKKQALQRRHLRKQASRVGISGLPGIPVVQTTCDQGICCAAPRLRGPLCTQCNKVRLGPLRHRESCSIRVQSPPRHKPVHWAPEMFRRPAKFHSLNINTQTNAIVCMKMG